MKTITEFAAATLKNAAKTQQELQTAGKTAEEMPQVLGEALKLEGDKLTMLLNALSVAESATKRLNDLKRVVVISLSEGEKAPSQAQQKGEHYYYADYYAPIPSKEPQKEPRMHGKGGRDKKGGKRGDKKGKPRRDGDRGGRGPRPQTQPGSELAGKTHKILPVIRPKDTAPKTTESKDPSTSS